MPLVKAKRDELLAPLSAVSGIIERRHTLPILSNVLIDRVDGELSFLATDIEIQITARSSLAAGADAKAITVGARKLLDILRALPEGAEVSSAAAGQAAASQGRQEPIQPADASSRGLSTPGAAGRRGGAFFPAAEGSCERLLALVQYAMAQQDIRYYLNGLLMLVDDRQLRAGRHRRASARLCVRGACRLHLPRIEVIVPRKTVLELSQAPGRQTTNRGNRAVGQRRRVLASGRSSWSPSWSTASFPITRASFRTQHKKLVALEREVLRQSLQRAAILSNEKFRGVRWVLDRRQPEDHLVQRRAGRGAGGNRSEVCRAMRWTSDSTSTTCWTC